MAGSGPGTSAGPGGDGGLWVFGIVRPRSRRRPLPVPGPGSVEEVAWRKVAALVRPVPFRAPEAAPALLREHHGVVEAVMHGEVILPFPYGVVFRSREGVERLLARHYLALDDALHLVRGRWEFRVVVKGRGAGGSGGLPVREAPSGRAEASGPALAEELSRYSRARIRLPRREGELLRSAFLVERDHWIQFVERATALEEAVGCAVDVTGPWPPYDFVRVVRPGA